MAYTLIDLVQIASRVFSVLIIARALLSWVSPDPRNAIVGLVYRLTEPVLAPVRKFTPDLGGIDVSPIIVLVGIQVLEQVLVQMLIGMA
ncbi:MAG TPA: YggT family protein [bacterium]|nr:YggT family protein [bacterium]